MELRVLLVMGKTECVLGTADIGERSTLLESVDVIHGLLSLVDKFSDFLGEWSILTSWGLDSFVRKDRIAGQDLNFVTRTDLRYIKMGKLWLHSDREVIAPVVVSGESNRGRVGHGGKFHNSLSLSLAL